VNYEAVEILKPFSDLARSAVIELPDLGSLILDPAVRAQVSVVRRLFATISNCFAVHLSGDNCHCTNRLRIKDLSVLTEFNCRI